MAHGRGELTPAAPDLFWRTIPGPLGRDDPRTSGRGQPRLEVIRSGERDMTDTLATVKNHPRSNGKAATIGFCFGGPFAILGPERLGYDAGVSCHGTQMLDYIGELERTTKPILIIWGDADHAAPPPVLDAYRALARHKTNLDLHVFPGVKHGYMMRDAAPDLYSPSTREFSMQKALAILAGLRT